MPARRSDSSAALETGVSPYFKRPIALVGPTELLSGPHGNRLAGCACTSACPRSLLLALVSLLLLSLLLRNYCGLQRYPFFVLEHVLWYLHIPGCREKVLPRYSWRRCVRNDPFPSLEEQPGPSRSAILYVSQLGVEPDKVSGQAMYCYVVATEYREGQGT